MSCDGIFPCGVSWDKFLLFDVPEFVDCDLLDVVVVLLPCNDSVKFTLFNKIVIIKMRR